MKRRKSDILWKEILEEVFADVLRFVFPDAEEVYDFDRGFEFLEKELAELNPQPDEGKDSRFADKLVKVYHRDGVEEWVLLHVEVQGDTNDRGAFAERMFIYFYRIRDRYGGRPVSAVAIFTGRSAKEILAAKMRLLEGKVSEDKLLEMKLLAAKRLLGKGFEKKKIRAIFKFLRNYVLFEMPEINIKFDNLISQTSKTSVMSMDDVVRLIEREETTIAIIENLLREFDLPVEKIASLANTTVELVVEVKNDLGIK